jgi:type I restriction enzyme, S subunit
MNGAHALSFCVPSDWRVVELADCCEFIRDGDWIETKDQGGADYRLLQVSNVGVGEFLETGNYRWITKETFERLRCTEILEGDVLIARMPEPTGRAWFVRNLPWRAVTAVDVAILRTRPEEMNARFLSYYLNSPPALALTESLTTGTTRSRIRRADIERFLVPRPTIEEQRRIAGVLGALDDKIDANRDLAESLNRTSRLIYLKLVSQSRAQSGWSSRPIGEMVSVLGGSTPSTRQPAYWDGPISFATPKDLASLDFPVLTRTDRGVTEAGLAQISSGLLPAGTVLLSSRAPIGYVAMTEKPVAVNQGFIAMICDRGLPNHYVLRWTENNQDTIVAYANGTTFLEINKRNFRTIPVEVPPADELERFTAEVTPLHRRLVATVRESDSLVKVRDALLSRLVSGEVRVQNNYEPDTPAAAR